MEKFNELERKYMFEYAEMLETVIEKTKKYLDGLDELCESGELIIIRGKDTGRYDEILAMEQELEEWLDDYFEG